MHEWIENRMNIDDIPEELKSIAAKTIRGLISLSTRQSQAIHDKNIQIESLKKLENEVQSKNLKEKAALYHILRAFDFFVLCGGKPCNVPSDPKEALAFFEKDYKDLENNEFWIELEQAAIILDMNKEAKRYKKKVK